MTIRPCLPRCFDPVFPGGCDMPNVPICCISWSLEGCDDETFTFDAGYIAGLVQDPFSIFCGTSKAGSTAIFLTGEETTLGTPFIGWRNCNGVISSTYGDTEQSIGCVFPATTPHTVPIEGCESYYPATWCFKPDYLDIPTTAEELPEGVSHYGCFPYLSWQCEGVGASTKVVFTAGWMVITQVLSESLSVWGNCYGIAVASGEIGTDWYEGGSPPSFYLAPLEDGYPGATVQPLVCNYYPCGDPLDCLAACISGTVDCDGVTPAHVPVIFFTLDIPGCCLSGTYPLYYDVPGGMGSGYYGSGFCVATETVSHTIDIALTCGRSADPGFESDALAVLWVRFGTITSFGTSYAVEVLEVLTLTCASGGLVPVTGEVNDTDCGDGDGTWALFG